jgi:hypothetical protein
MPVTCFANNMKTKASRQEGKDKASEPNFLQAVHLDFMIKGPGNKHASINRVPHSGCDAEFVAVWVAPVHLEQGLVL